MPEFIKSTTQPPGIPSTGATASSQFAMGDFNADGFTDVAYTQADWPDGSVTSPLTIWLGQRDGTFEIADQITPAGPVLTQFTGFILTADFNSDGVDDLYMATYGNELAQHPEPDVVLLSQPGGTFVRSTSVALQRLQWSHGSSIGDIDGDGDIDIFQSGMTGLDDPTKAVGHLLLNDGRGNFVDAKSHLPPELSARVGSQIFASEIVDLNGDGFGDLVIGHAGGHAVREVNGNIEYLPTGTPGKIYFGKAGGGFGGSTSLPLGSYAAYNTDTVDIKHADLDGDGDLDLILSNYNAGWVSDGRGNIVRIEDGNFSEDPPLEAAYQWRDVQLLINNGDGTFADQTNRIQNVQNGLGIARYLSDLTPVDLNADGFLDLLANPSTSLTDPKAGNYAWLNDGTGNFVVFDLAAQLAAQGIDSAYMLSVHDMDGDGDQDLVYSGWGPVKGSNDGGPSFVVLYNQTITLLVEGTRGKDNLAGDERDNVIDGKQGKDKLSGNTGADTFILGKAYGKDTILDFDTMENDKIDVSNAVGINNFNDLAKHHVADSSDDTKISAADGAMLIIKNIDFNDLAEGMFIF